MEEKNIKGISTEDDALEMLMRGEANVLSKSLLSSASKDFLDYFKEENIGADCNPKCGSCQCGGCALGGKAMSIKNEREYEIMKNNLHYDPVGSKEDPGPYWRSKFPWEIDRDTLGDNKSVVLGTLNGYSKEITKGSSVEENIRGATTSSH